MGHITDYMRYTKGNKVKNIFIYSTGKITVNRVIVHNLAEVIANLIINGYTKS